MASVKQLELWQPPISPPIKLHKTIFTEEEIKPKPMVRPPCQYTNIRTPYGIATEMLEQQLAEELKIRRKAK